MFSLIKLENIVNIAAKITFFESSNKNSENILWRVWNFKVIMQQSDGESIKHQQDFTLPTLTLIYILPLFLSN